MKKPATSSADPFVPRLARLEAAAADTNAAVLLITNPKDVGYLTGFHGGDSYLLMPISSNGGRGTPVLISDFRYQEELAPVTTAGLAEVYIRKRSMGEALEEVLGQHFEPAKGEPARVGVQSEHMTVAERSSLSRRIGSKRVTDTLGLVSRLRAIKDDGEVSLIRKAAKIQQEALRAVLPDLKPGISELEVASRLEAEMKSRGSSEPGFQTIVAAGANGSLPHYRPKDKKLAANKPVLIDWGAVYRGYHADMTRVFVLGKWPEKVREIYQIVLEAHLAAADALAPGMTTKQIDTLARDHIAKAGYAEHFGHGLGHGLGLNAHEDPRVTNMLAPTPLEPGMVVTIEPGIYLPGVGGVRLEDDYVITEDGHEHLCTMKMDVEFASL